ncbi:MurR/RpiR family transcriptional regulator [Streptomyces nanhaiensis]|uniref:MurR/RpiR family transcriptional regulator n=1 Tax=Streptomyces nanhaiensis TaxID=679319 RepID=UPI00399C56A6
MSVGKQALGETLRKELGRFSRAERRVARVLLADYPAAGLTTVAALADRAGVSAPTVVRFARRFGFASYTDFQQALRREVQERQVSPLTRFPGPVRDAGRGGDGDRAGEHGTESLVDYACEVLTAGTRETLTSLPPDEVRAAVGLLADPSNRLTLGGGRFTRLLAHYFALHLMQLRRGARLLPVGDVELASFLAEVDRRDVLVLFDYRRYEQATSDIARLARNSGAKIILFTDRWLSPVAGFADVVLSAAVEAPSSYDSLVPTLAVIETLVAELIRTGGGITPSHLKHVERISQDLRLL